MKNKLIYIAAVWLAYVCVGCSHEDMLMFKEDSGVYFTQKKTAYSFRDHIGVETDTVYLSVGLFGDTAAMDRTVEVKVVEQDSALLATPERYRILSGVVPAGKFEGNVAVEINYGEELADTTYSIFLEIVPNHDFSKLVDFRTQKTELQISAIRIPPANWSQLTMFFGTYEDEWWDYILEQTGMTSLPYWYNASDTDTWWMSQTEVMICARIVKRALKEYEYENPGQKLCYKNGDPWIVQGI